ncbi:hypothetical protein [Algoriphagus namhaensis]
MRNRNFYLLIFGMALMLSSCKQDPSPLPANTSELRISNMKFTQDQTNENDRRQQAIEWKHPLPESLQLTFRSAENIGSYNLSLNPNDLAGSPTLQIPFGTYTVSGGEWVEGTTAVLHFIIDQTVVVNSSKLGLELEAQTNQGLLTIFKDDLNIAPVIEGSEKFEFFEKNEVYYAYSSLKSSQKVELRPKETNSYFRSYWTAQPLQQQFWDLSPAASEERSGIISADFELRKWHFKLDENGKPQILIPSSPISLDESERENSGLAYFQGRLFSINDGGNAAEISEIEPETGDVIRKIKVNALENIDWEDLAQSDEHLYIGDFGNNSGTRTNLRIIKIAWSDVLNSEIVEGELISYAYEDQTDFSGSNPNHNFDCEAFVYSSGELLLFTKNRGDGRSNQYAVPTLAGSHVARKISSFDTEGLITAATLSLNRKHLMLLGYNLDGISSGAFIWVFEDFDSQGMNPKAANRYELGTLLNLGQSEGLIATEGMEVILSSERLTQGPFRIAEALRQLDLEGLY